jgi:hypothetical protein
MQNVPKWVWIVGAVLAIGAVYYLHRANTASAAPSSASPGVDESALASDIAQQIASSIANQDSSQDTSGQGSDDSALLAELLAAEGQTQQSEQDFLANYSQLVASGVSYGSGGYSSSPAGQTDTSPLGIGGTAPSTYTNDPTIGGYVNYGYENPGTIGIGAYVGPVGAYFPNSTGGGSPSQGYSYGANAPTTPPPTSAVGSGASKGAQ